MKNKDNKLAILDEWVNRGFLVRFMEAKDTSKEVSERIIDIEKHPSDLDHPKLENIL